MKSVNTEEFNALMEQNVRIRQCPHCGFVAEVRVTIPMYGMPGAKVQCARCECQTAYTNINLCFAESDGMRRIGTPITPESMMEGIMKAIKIWNGEDKDE